ncbi:MAG: hypothetical protein L0Y56_19725 [Nitrospira sp.]|nr:hypothetical protein [Nitrospira sp.]
MDKTAFLQILKENLPQLLKEDERFRYEIKGLLAETFSSKDELQAVLEQVLALREDTNRRFDQQDEQLREIQVQLTSLSGRLGRGYEQPKS